MFIKLLALPAQYMRNRAYETARCPSVRLSVCQATYVCPSIFQHVGPACTSYIDRLRQQMPAVPRCQRMRTVSMNSRTEACSTRIVGISRAQHSGTVKIRLLLTIVRTRLYIIFIIIIYLHSMQK